MADEIEWFLGRDGQQYGPIAHEEIQTLVRLNHLRPDDLVWHVGLPAWRPAAEVFARDGSVDVGPEAPAPVSAPKPEPVAEAAPKSREPDAHPTSVGSSAAGAAPQPVPETYVPPPAAVRQPSRIEVQPTFAPVERPLVAALAPQPPVATMAPVAPPAPVRAPAVRLPASGRVKSRRRVALAVAAPAILLAAGAALYLFWDDIAGAGPAAAVDKPAIAAATSAERPTPPDEALRPAFATGLVWKQVSADFPAWFAERVREVERKRRDEKADDDAIGKFLIETLVSLRRNHASDALASGPDRIRRMASTFVDNIDALRTHSVEACFDFISNGESGEVVFKSQKSKDVATRLDAQLASIFEAINEGRRQPVTHLPPTKADYDVLAGELVKLGWTDQDLRVFSDPRQLLRASPQQVCRLVRDWFTAQLSIGDRNVQLRLLIESLKPVVEG